MHERETLVAMRSAFALETQTSYRVNDNHNQLRPSKYCSIDMGWEKGIVDNGSFALRQQLERLYIDHHAWLSGLLRRKLGNATDAADLAHDIYLNLIRKGSIPAPDDCRCHLTQIAKGMLIDLYRRRRLEASHLERMRQQEAPLGPSEESRALAFEALTQVTAAMNLQPPKARQALLPRDRQRNQGVGVFRGEIHRARHARLPTLRQRSSEQSLHRLRIFRRRS
jgi:DNA-directed RNA polymerase specialized sigma24 family protein